VKVLMVRSLLSDNGPGTQSLTLAKDLRKRDVNVMFAAGGGAYVENIRQHDFLVEEIPELSPHGRSPFRTMRCIQRLRQVIVAYRPQIIHGHNAASTICGWLASVSAGTRLPCVTSVRGVEERPTHQWRNLVWRTTPGILLGVCEKTKERLLGYGVPENKIRVTYNGVDIERFTPLLKDGAEVRREFGLRGKIVVGCVGAMVAGPGIEGPTKGQDNLIRAIANLKDDHPNIMALLVGDGPRRGMLEQLACHLGVTDKVIFAGRRFDVERMLSAMDIYCLASTFGEFFPNSIIEAMAMELPWVGSDIAGLGELTAQGEAGWLSPPGDVEALTLNLRKLVQEKELRTRRGRRGRLEVEERFTTGHVVKRLLAAYDAAGAAMGSWL